MGKKQSVMAAEGSEFQLVPDDILAEIFLRLPSLDVVRSCVLVCKDWNRVANMQTLWKDKCVRDFQFPEDQIRLLAGEDFKVLYLRNPYCRNLLRNPDAHLGMLHWEVTIDAGAGWRIEDEPCFVDPVEDFAKTDNKRPDQCYIYMPKKNRKKKKKKEEEEEEKKKRIGCWATSYHTCKKEQLIDLVKEGCTERVLDQLRPDIVITEWGSARFGCGVRYLLEVKLLAEEVVDGKIKSVPDYEKPLDQCDIELRNLKGSDRAWFPVKHTFSGYPQSVRYVQYTHGCMDYNDWDWGPACEGALMTLSSVKFDISHCSGSL